MRMTENKKTVTLERGNWANQVEFLLSCLGYAVGLGNVWRFPFLVYKNGGAAFLLPYGLMLLCAGLPMFFMELTLGQYVSYGPNILFQKISPIFSGVGWAMVAISLMTCVYYNLIIAWGIYFVFASFQSVLPWGNCNNYFNSPECFDQNEASNCKNQSLQYYNKSCLTTEEYCNIAGLEAHNSTHCHEENTSIIDINGIITRTTPGEEYFQNRLLGITGKTWEDMGSIQWEIVGCLALAWVLVTLCIIRGIRTSGKVVYITATFPYIILLIFLIRGLTLKGSYKGIEYYILNTNWTKLTEVEVWSDAASQIFFSLGISFGSLITLSSYNKFNTNCMRNAVLIGCSNCLTSVFAGFVIFSVLGFLSNELGVEVKEVVTSGSGLVFVVYPTAINLMPLPQLWSVLFFLMLIAVGLGTQFSMMETVITSLCDQFESLRRKKPIVVSVVCFATFLMGLSMCLEGGTYMFELFTWHAAGLSLIIMAFFQIVVVQYVYGFKKFMANVKEMNIRMSKVMEFYWSVTWTVVTPLSLGAIFCFSIYFMVPIYHNNYVFPENIQILGWFIFAASIICVPLGALWVLCRRERSFKSLFQASPDFCPAHIRNDRVTWKRNAFAQRDARAAYSNDAFSDMEEKMGESSSPPLPSVLLRPDDMGVKVITKL